MVSANNDSEPEQWERDISMIITKAMQAGIMTWQNDQFKSLADKAQVEVMVSLTKQFSSKASKVVRRLLEQKSS